VGRIIDSPTPNHAIEVRTGQAVVIEAAAGALIEPPDLQPVIHQQLVSLIERCNLGASGQPDSDDNANGKYDETMLCCNLFNAIKRRRSLPLFAGWRLFWDLDANSKNVVPNNTAVSADCNPPFQPRQSCGDVA
jgi:hypothetical protein